MSNPIDIAVPVLLPNDGWYEEYKKYNKNEHPGRIRDMGTFKYVLRSIAKNMPWINRIFIILFDKTQIPDWLNTDCPKIKVLCHKDILPPERLPNFSSVQVDMRLSFIDELSDNFIFINDDMFFNKPIKETDYFRDGKPVHIPSMKQVNNYNNLTKAQWGKIEFNNYDFLNRIVGQKLHFWTGHAPIPFNKTFQQFIWNKYKDEFNKKLSGSHLRADNNICNWLFYNMEEYYRQSVNVPADKLPARHLLQLNDRMDERTLTRMIERFPILCINDGNGVSAKGFDKVKRVVNNVLNKKYPNKSEFEK